MSGRRLDNHASSKEAPSLSDVLAWMKAGRYFLARETALKVLENCGASKDLLMLLAAIHDQLGLSDAGIHYVSQYLAIDAHDLQALTLRTRLFQRAGRTAEAIKASDAALKVFPGNVDLLLLRAETLEQGRQPGAALETLQPLLGRTPVPPIAAGLAARALQALGRLDESVAWARQGATDPRASPAVSRSNWMQVAKVYDSLGQYDFAMDAALNAHARRPGKFDRSAFLDQIDSLLATFAPKNLTSFARGSDRSQLPLFLVGMPRSGTSLVEQIISCHPNAYGAGELADITAIARNLMQITGSEYLYPDCVDDLSPDLAQRLAQSYLERLSELGGSALRVTNKAVDQYEHVGLEWLLFPGARVIHVNRDPLDTCVSCFTRPLDSNVMSYVTSFDDLGVVYVQYQRLMNHWKQTLDLPILTVQYEELVADQERITRQMIDFLGLPWDDRCLRYWETDRTVMTLSYDQVNKPIYDSSIGRWKNYEKHLGPLKAALGLS